MNHKELSIQVDGLTTNAKLYTYLWDHSEELYPVLRPMIILCPGGGYVMTSDREAEALAIKFMAMGCHAAVLRYSVAPAVYPTALLELAKAVALIREHAKEWHIDTNKILLQGSSAGGHLAASLGVFWKERFLSERLGVATEQLRPNGLILSYPVITSKEYAHLGSFVNLLGDSYERGIEKMSLEDQVSADTPKTFIWHTFSDDCVPVENALLFVLALRKYHIPTEFHMYPVGNHGLATAGELTKCRDGSGLQKECESWMPLVETWLGTL